MHILFNKRAVKIDTGVKSNIIDFDADAPSDTTIRFIDSEMAGIALHRVTISELREYLTNKDKL